MNLTGTDLTDHTATQHTGDTGSPIEDRMVRLAALLQPCPRPDLEAGWDLCSHAEPWPCVITRAAWIAAGHTESETQP